MTTEDIKSFTTGTVLVSAWVIVFTLPSILIVLYDIRSLLK